MAILQIFYSPAAAFASVRDKKWAWILPAVLMMALSIATVALLLGRFSAVAIMEDQIAQSGQELPPQGVGQMAGFVTAIMYVSPLISTPVMILVGALILLAIVKGFSGETAYPNMLNATAFALWGYSLIMTLLFLAMLFSAPDLSSFQLQNPVPLNAGYFFDPAESGKALVAFLSSINLLNFYLMWLFALGASTLSNRVTTGKVLGPLIAIYVIFALGRTGFAAIF